MGDVRKRIEFRGSQFSVHVITRDDCPNDAVQIMSEDDENWFEHGSQFDAAYLDDLIAVLQAAKNICKIGFTP